MKLSSVHAFVTALCHAAFMNAIDKDTNATSLRYAALKAVNSAKSAGDSIPSLFDPGSDKTNTTWDNEPYRWDPATWKRCLTATSIITDTS